MSLPEWIENLKHCGDGPEHCDGCMKLPLTIQALAIGWTALDKMEHTRQGYEGLEYVHAVAKEALRRIAALGEPKKEWIDGPAYDTWKNASPDEEMGK